MDSAGVENVVSETTQTYREGIRAYFDGDRETAVSSLEKVLEEQPANGLAETYLGKAKELPAPPAEEKGSDYQLGRLDRSRGRHRGRDRRRTHRADPAAAPGAAYASAPPAAVAMAPAPAPRLRPRRQPPFGQPQARSRRTPRCPPGSRPAPRPLRPRSRSRPGGGVAVKAPVARCTAPPAVTGMDTGTNFCGSCGTRNEPRA